MMKGGMGDQLDDWLSTWYCLEMENVQYLWNNHGLYLYFIGKYTFFLWSHSFNTTKIPNRLKKLTQVNKKNVVWSNFPRKTSASLKYVSTYKLIHQKQINWFVLMQTPKNLNALVSWKWWKEKTVERVKLRILMHLAVLTGISPPTKANFGISDLLETSETWEYLCIYSKLQWMG